MPSRITRSDEDSGAEVCRAGASGDVPMPPAWDATGALRPVIGSTLAFIPAAAPQNGHGLAEFLRSTRPSWVGFVASILRRARKACHQATRTAHLSPSGVV